MRAGLAIVFAIALPARAWADRISVKVVEVAGGVAYVEPGASAGLGPGTKLSFGPVAREVIAVTDTAAIVKLDGLVLSPGQTGTADVTPGGHAVVIKRAEVHAPDSFRDQWPAATHPADAQDVASVPLGSAKVPGAIHVAVLGHGYAAIERHGTGAAQGEARVVASFDVLNDRPLAAEADVAVRGFSTGADKTLHTPLFVRALQVRYGNSLDPTLALGRLRFAATSVGMLDGGRAMFRTGSLEVAAFGGVVPDPISGRPDTSVSRFGAEAVFDAIDNDWQPRIGLTAIGSTFGGQLDERRLVVSATANRGSLLLDGWAEAQSFAANNPWGAAAVELTGAGLAAEWRSRGAHLGADITFLRPERSLRLASALPSDWLCTRAPQPGDVATESCRGDDSSATASMSAGLRRGRFVVDGIGTVGRSHAVSTSYTSSAYLRAELHIDRHRLVLGSSVGRAEFGAWTSGEGGIGSLVTTKLDVEVRYRAELLDYVAATKALLLHAIIADVRYRFRTNLDLGLSALATTGMDRSALGALATFAWRPLP